MYKRYMLISMLVLVFLPVMNAQSIDKTKEGKEIRVTLTNINEVKGEIVIGLFNDENTFPKQYMVGLHIVVLGKKMTGIFRDIAPGQYAIAAYHDINVDGKLNKNFLGIPQEGYAFSNNVFGIIGPPDFAKAAFKVEDKDVKLSIKLKY